MGGLTCQRELFCIALIITEDVSLQNSDIHHSEYPYLLEGSVKGHLAGSEDPALCSQMTGSEDPALCSQMSHTNYMGPRVQVSGPIVKG